jgi:uncharacterized OB-fold protein
MSTPAIDATIRAALERGRPVLPRCTRCGTLRWPPREVCHACLSAETGWVELGGGGAVVSFVVVRTGPNPARALPYCVVHVELDEGPRMTGNLLNAPPEAARIGLRVRTVVEATPAGPLLQFEPDRSALTRA